VSRLPKLITPKVADAGTGQGITIAVIDSGVNFDHPHLNVRGTSFEVYRDEDGAIEARKGPVRDQYGHGTCCTALIHFLAPAAALIAVKVTAEASTTDADRLAYGIETAVRNGADIVCVPMATQTRLRLGLDQAVSDAVAQNSLVVAADPGFELALPAHCPGALAVQACDGVDVEISNGNVVADGAARPFGPKPGNFAGPSLSAARAAAAMARFAEISNFRGEDLMTGFKNLLTVL